MIIAKILTRVSRTRDAHARCINDCRGLKDEIEIMII